MTEVPDTRYDVPDDADATDEPDHGVEQPADEPDPAFDDDADPALEQPVADEPDPDDDADPDEVDAELESSEDVSVIQGEGDEESRAQA